MLTYSRVLCSAKPIGVNAQASKAAFCLPQRGTQVLSGHVVSWTPVQCINADLQQSGMQCKTHRCECTDKQGCFMLASKSGTGAERVFTRFWASVLCINADLQHSGMQCKTHRCECMDKQGFFLLASKSGTGAQRVFTRF